MTSILIDTKPLSVNQAWRSGPRYRSKEYLQYEKDVLKLLPKMGKVKGEFEIDITFYTKNYKRCDADNIVKPLLDILKKAGMIEDDSKCVRLQVFKEKSDKNYLELDILQVEN